MLTLKKGYLLHEIGGTTYLLPYGQNIADLRSSIRLNEPGLLIYHALEQGADESSLLDTLITHYQAEDSDIPALKEDIDHFLFQLEGVGLLSRPKNTTPDSSDISFRIGPAVIDYYGPKELLEPSLLDFSCEDDTSDMAIRIIPMSPAMHDTGELLVRTDELIICKTDTSYLFLYPADYGIAEAQVSLDGRQASFFCPKPYDGELSEKLFQAFRFAYLIRVQRMGAFAIHSASILYNGKAWLFSGPSGTGKSTHTAIWNRRYKTPYLNGDLNLLGFVDGAPVVYGIPWCGTSGCYTTETIPLGGITFLKQAHTDTLSSLSEEEIMFRTMQRLISPSWTEDLLLLNLSFVEKLCDKISFFHLKCTKEDSAAAVIKQAIDEI